MRGNLPLFEERAPAEKKVSVKISERSPMWQLDLGA
jgi:hypothetical protein